MATLTDWAASANSATLETATDYGTATHPSYVHDLSEASASRAMTDDNDHSAYYIYTITFAHTATIERFAVRTYQRRGRTNFFIPEGKLEYYNGEWQTLRAEADLPLYPTTYKYPDGPYPNVSKLRWTVSDLDRSYSIWTGGWKYGYAYTYFLQAWGRRFYDGCGLRYYDGAAVRTIAVETLDGHKVRVRGPGGVTYGVPVVATDHPQAASLYFYDGTETKAFVDIT